MMPLLNSEWVHLLASSMSGPSVLGEMARDGRVRLSAQSDKSLVRRSSAVGAVDQEDPGLPQPPWAPRVGLLITPLHFQKRRDISDPASEGTHLRRPQIRSPAFSARHAMTRRCRVRSWALPA